MSNSALAGAGFLAAAVAQLAAWQRANMPDRAFVFVRQLSRAPGGVSLERYVFAWVDPCRISFSQSQERASSESGGAFSELRTWTLARPPESRRFDGTERVLVMPGPTSHGRAAYWLRVVSEGGTRTFQTVRKAQVTTTAAGTMLVATARSGRPAALRITSPVVLP